MGRARIAHGPAGHCGPLDNRSRRPWSDVTVAIAMPEGGRCEDGSHCADLPLPQSRRDESHCRAELLAGLGGHCVTAIRHCRRYESWRNTAPRRGGRTQLVMAVTRVQERTHRERAGAVVFLALPPRARFDPSREGPPRDKRTYTNNPNMPAARFGWPSYAPHGAGMRFRPLAASLSLVTQMTRIMALRKLSGVARLPGPLVPSDLPTARPSSARRRGRRARW